MRFPPNVLKSRLKRFQGKIWEMGLDGVMLRALSSYIYFTGVKWLRPSLFIPREGEPIAFVAEGEKEGFMERTWISNIVTYTDGRDLMSKVIRLLRDHDVRKIGMEFGLERDAYILFYELFKKLNPKIEITDIGSILAEMRMIKDDYEVSAIRKAGEKAVKAMEKALSIVRQGVSETELAAEIYSMLYKLGSEEPHVYINAGPHPRVHAEPFRDLFIEKNTFVTIIVAADHDRYYADMTRTVYVGDSMSTEVKRVIKCSEEVYSEALELTRPGVKLMTVIDSLDKIYARHGLLKHRVIGYTHGVGLQVEEPPITTIVPQHRAIVVKPRMVLAFIHSPIMYEGLGQFKKEDTFIVGEDGLENVTGLE